MTSLDDLLKAPTAAPIGKAKPEIELTHSIAVTKNTVEAEIRAPEGSVNEGTGLEYLKEEGLNPDEWEATHFRKIKYGAGMESVKFSYRRVAFGLEGPPVSELLGAVKRGRAKADRPTGDHGFIVAIGDLQVGKLDGDGVEGTVARAVACIDRAAALLLAYRKRFSIGHVHVAWLGDHLEGFVSQGGANTWRTQLPLSDQIRIVRRLMLYAAEVFAPLAERVTFAAVPGNHGEPQRFNSKGVTRYSDSHDTESLVAVSEACAMNPKAYGHCEFYVPTGDDMTVTLDIAGTTVSHVHGHQFRPGKHFQWWQGQAFGGGLVADADLLLAGHLHHFHVDTSGPRMFLQVPALESESTWYKLATGTPGDPGIVVAITKDGLTSPTEIVR